MAEKAAGPDPGHQVPLENIGEFLSGILDVFVMLGGALVELRVVSTEVLVEAMAALERLADERAVSAGMPADAPAQLARKAAARILRERWAEMGAMPKPFTVVSGGRTDPADEEGQT